MKGTTMTPMQRANQKVREFADEHTIEYLVCCAVAGYAIGKLLQKAFN